MRSQGQEPNNIKILRYKCRVCKDVSFSTQREWKRHMIDEHSGQPGDKALGCNAWNSQPRDTSQRTLGHKPSLDDYDRLLH